MLLNDSSNSKYNRKLVNKYLQVSIQVWTLLNGFIYNVINDYSSNTNE